jgi:integrase
MPGQTKVKKVDFRGQMAPFTPEDLQLIRAKLKAQEAWRDLALINVGVDTMLRAGDLVRLRVNMLRDHTGTIVKAFALRQTKTREPVHLGLSDRTRDAVARLIEAYGKYGDDFLFTRQGQAHGQHLSDVALRLLVKGWAAIAERDPSKYSGHSLRRTKAVLVYRETNNAELVRQMLGHTSLAHTVAYLGVKGEDVSAMSRRFEI